MGSLCPTRSCRAPKIAVFEITLTALLCGLPAIAAHAQQAAGPPATDSPVIVQPGAPGTPTKTLPPSTSAAAPRASQADIDFMQGMIMHHSQAVEMTALIPSHTEDKDVRAIGARISRSQSDEINFMKRWLVARGQSTSMAMPGMPDMNKNGELDAHARHADAAADGGVAPGPRCGI